MTEPHVANYTHVVNLLDLLIMDLQAQRTSITTMIHHNLETRRHHIQVAISYIGKAKGNGPLNFVPEVCVLHAWL